MVEDTPSECQPPYWNPASSIAVVADSRLDNRDDLAKILEFPLSHGNIPDSHFILRAWEKWGPDCPLQLYGDFAFGIWDAGKQVLFCARDHIGTRPMYYCLTSDQFVFASHIRKVLDVPGVSDTLDENYIAGMLSNNYETTELTYFKAIRKIPPAHSFLVSRGTRRLKKYWDPGRAATVRFARDSEYVEASRSLLNNCIRDRLRGTDRVGVHVTGGLDSSTVAILAAREHRRQGKPAPVGYCWQPPPDGKMPVPWEHAFIEAVCAQEGLQINYCPPTAEDMLAVICHDPARDPITQAQYFERAVQVKAASHGIRTILSGWGGDESLSYYGRGYYAGLFFRGRWGQAYRDARQLTDRACAHIAREVLTAFHPEAPGIVRYWLKGKPRLTGRNNFINPGFARRVKPHPITQWRESSIRSRLASAWASAVHAERMESWYHHGARLGIVYSYPYLDRKVLEFAAGLPPDQFIRGPWTRWLMRNVGQGILPEELCWHRDKSDPVFRPIGASAVQQTLERIGHGLAAAPGRPTRAQYIDMPSLLDRLRPEKLREDQRAGALLRTVQFLDLEGIEAQRI